MSSVYSVLKSSGSTSELRSFLWPGSRMDVSDDPLSQYSTLTIATSRQCVMTIIACSSSLSCRSLSLWLDMYVYQWK